MEQEIKRIAKCDVCKNMLEIDQYGNSNACPNCGWRQSEEAYQHPNVAGIRNIPSLNNIRYGVLYDDDNEKIALLNIQTNEKQLFNDIYDFEQNAKINGKLLRNLWNNVTSTDFLQEI